MKVLIIFFILLVIFLVIVATYNSGILGGGDNPPKVGDYVKIHIKPYKGEFHEGIVCKVLTKKRKHSRGHKVMLMSGKIGRIYKD